MGGVKDGIAGESGVAHEMTLLRFAEAAVSDDPGELDAAARQLRTELGDAAFVDSAGVVASFNSVVRIADATGIVMEDAKIARTADLRQELGIED